MKYEKMLDFLLFGYFGCDGSDDADTMRNRAAHRAYLDLARTVNYRLSTSQLAEKLKKRSSEYEKKEAETFIKKKGGVGGLRLRTSLSASRRGF